MKVVILIDYEFRVCIVRPELFFPISNCFVFVNFDEIKKILKLFTSGLSGRCSTIWRGRSSGSCCRRGCRCCWCSNNCCGSFRRIWVFYFTWCRIFDWFSFASFTWGMFQCWKIQLVKLIHTFLLGITIFIFFVHNYFPCWTDY